MSDRSVVKTEHSIDTEQASLDTLRTSKDLGTATAASLSQSRSADTDLSQVSIPSSGIPRVSAKTDKRIIRTPNLTASNEVDTDKSREASRKEAGEAAATGGILKNPHYAYQGNLIERFVTFVANILKTLERILLRFLSGEDAPLPKPTQQSRVPESDTPAPDEERKKREEREKLQRELSIHRS